MPPMDLLIELNRRLGALPNGPGRLTGELTRIEGGWASTVLHTVTLTHDDGTTRAVVVKCYAPDDAGRAHAEREHRALTGLARAGQPVPAVVAFAATPDPPVLVMSRVDGESLGSLLVDADPATCDRLTDAFADRLVALHALDPAVLDPRSAASFEAVDHELAGLTHDLGAPEHAGLGHVVGWLRERRDTVPCARPVILHRDFHPWNVLVDGAGDLWVLDWDWTVGDPRFDLAWTRTLLQRSGWDAAADRVRDRYLTETDSTAEGLAFYEVLTTTRWLMNVLPALGPSSQLDAAKRAAFADFLVEPLQRARALLTRHTGLAGTG